jgi:hypothetical protein
MIDEKDFERLERSRRFAPQTVEIAKRRLLKGERAAELATAYGLNFQRIYAIEMQITAALQELEVPAGWEEITVIAPKALCREIEVRVRAAREKLERGPAHMKPFSRTTRTGQRKT